MLNSLAFLIQWHETLVSKADRMTVGTNNFFQCLETLHKERQAVM